MSTKLKKANELAPSKEVVSDEVKASDVVNAEHVYDPEIYAEAPGRKIESLTQDFDSTLFKLETAQAIKNTGIYQSKYDEYDKEAMKEFDHEVDHCHYLRTRESDGRIPQSMYTKPTHPQGIVMKSTAIGGHYHLIEVIPNKNPGEPPIVISVSEPMVVGSKKRGQKYVQTEIPANEYDKHKHKIRYLRTDKVKVRTKNARAASVAAFEANKGKAQFSKDEGQVLG